MRSLLTYVIKSKYLCHSIEFFCKTRFFISGGILFKNALRNCAVDYGAGIREQRRCGRFVARVNQRKEFLNFGFNLIALFLSVFFSVTNTRFFADFILGILYLLWKGFTLISYVILS